MTVLVAIPTALRQLTGGLDLLEAEGANVSAVIAYLDARYSGFRYRLLDDGGRLRRFVNIYVDGEDIRFLDGLGTSLQEGVKVSIIPAVAGGAQRVVRT